MNRIWGKMTGRYKEAEELLNRALKIEENILGKTELQVANTLFHLGVCIRETGCRQEDAEIALQRALEITQAKLGKGDLQVANILHQLVPFARNQDRHEDAEASLKLALTIRKTHLGDDDLQVAYTLHELGVFIGRAGRWQEAEVLLRRALEIEEVKLGEGNGLVSSTIYQLARCKKQNGMQLEADALLRRSFGISGCSVELEVDEHVVYVLDQVAGVSLEGPTSIRRYETILRRALEIDEANLGKGRVEVGYKLHKLGACIGNYSRPNDVKRQAEAIRLLKRAVGIYEESSDKIDSSLQLAYALHDLGVCTRKTGLWEEAETLLRRSLAMKEEKLGERGVSLCRTLNQLVCCLRNMQQNKEAEALHQRALDLVETKHENSAPVALKLHDIGEYFLGELGYRDGAEAVLWCVLKMEEEIYGERNVQSGYTLYHLGVSISQTTRREEAIVLLERALEIFEAQMENKPCGERKDEIGRFHSPSKRSRLANWVEDTSGSFEREIENTRRQLARTRDEECNYVR